jgi:uncharacterized membrane protein
MFWAMMAVFFVFFLIYFGIRQSRENKRQIKEQRKNAELITDAYNAYNQWMNGEINFDEYLIVYEKQRNRT